MPTKSASPRMREIAIQNGRVVAPSQTVVAVDDWGVRYGWGLFETLRVHRGCPLFCERHLARMCSSAVLLGMTKDAGGLTNLWMWEIRQALADSRARDGVINCYWTRGAAGSRAKAQRIVRLRPLPKYPRRALRLWVAPWRIEPTYPGVGVKTLAYFPYIFAGVAARQHGCDEAIILNTSNRLADGAASSIFIITDDKIITPRLDEGTLAGITRGIVLGQAKAIGIRSVERRVQWSRLELADAVFVASSLRGLVPAKQVGELMFSRSAQHPLFLRLRTAHEQAVEADVIEWHSSR